MAKRRVPEPQPATEPAEAPSLKGFSHALRLQLGTLLDLRGDTDRSQTTEEIKRNVDFAGANLWSLIFAIIIASIGLNINSTAVIIGAMLISPLMGPIMGAGLAMGTYDFALLKRSLMSLAVATMVAIVASTTYFWLSPLGEAQSELLARTTPTVYDVLIAVFGGAAGIVAGARRDKTNAIPGVAIATALMPPLCTAGFGIAQGEWSYFLGAFYLYFINCTFIGLSTFVFVQVLRFRKAAYPDPVFVKRVRIYMLVFALVTMFPSVYMAVGLVRQTVFRTQADRFIRENFRFPRSRVLRTDLRYEEKPPTIEVTLVGDALSADAIDLLKDRLQAYRLRDVRLVVHNATGAGATQAVQEKTLALSRGRDERLRLLEEEVRSYRDRSRFLPRVSREISILFPDIQSFSFGDLSASDIGRQDSSVERTFIARWKTPPRAVDRSRLELYLKSRLELEKLRVVHD